MAARTNRNRVGRRFSTVSWIYLMRDSIVVCEGGCSCVFVVVHPSSLIYGTMHQSLPAYEKTCLHTHLARIAMNNFNKEDNEGQERK